MALSARNRFYYGREDGMKIQNSKGKSHISVNARGTGDGLVVIQGQNRTLMTWDEWDEMVAAGNAIRESVTPRKRYRMA